MIVILSGITGAGKSYLKKHIINKLNFKNIGIIIIDEEHDSSYKSESNPRYSAKEVAQYIAKKENCPLLLGSATPDITTFTELGRNGTNIRK